MTSIWVILRTYIRVLSIEKWNGMEIGAAIDEPVIDYSSRLVKAVSRIG